MLETNIEKFIIGGCTKDVEKYREYIRQTGRIDYNGSQWTYVVELMIITIKSLIPWTTNYGNVIDYKRFNEELKLWYYYRHGDNDSLLGYFNRDSKLYWEYEDNSIYSRIVPIVFANDDWTIARNEVIKNILYTTGKITSVLEGLTLAKILFILIKDEQISYENLINKVKKEIVCFSQKSFINDFAQYFQFKTSTYFKNYSIDFERMRIKLLNTLNRIDENEEYKTLLNALKIICEPVSNYEYSNFYLEGLKALRNKSELTDIKDLDFIKKLCAFLVKLRKGRIPIESLQITEYELPDIFQFSEGDIFFHSLLNKCQVIKKVRKKDMYISYIKTKSGIYTFRKYYSKK